MMKESRNGRLGDTWKGLYLTPIANLAGLMRPTDSRPQTGILFRQTEEWAQKTEIEGAWDRGGPASENLGKTSTRMELVKVFLGVENTSAHCLGCITYVAPYILLYLEFFFLIFSEHITRLRCSGQKWECVCACSK